LFFSGGHFINGSFFFFFFFFFFFSFSTTDGLFLINLADACFNESPPTYHHRAKDRTACVENINAAMACLARASVPTNWFTADEIYDCDIDAILNFVWMLIVLHSLAPHLPAPPKSDSLEVLTNDVAGQLVAWCRRRLSAYPMIVIKDLGSRSFGDGLALCALVHVLDASALSFDNDVVPGAAMHNVQLAIDSAAKSLDIIPTLDARDFLAPGPDDACLMVFVGELLAWYRLRFGKPGQERRAEPAPHLERAKPAAAAAALPTPTPAPAPTPIEHSDSSTLLVGIVPTAGGALAASGGNSKAVGSPMLAPVKSSASPASPVVTRPVAAIPIAKAVPETKQQPPIGSPVKGSAVAKSVDSAGNSSNVNVSMRIDDGATVMLASGTNSNGDVVVSSSSPSLPAAMQRSTSSGRRNNSASTTTTAASAVAAADSAAADARSPSFRQRIASAFSGRKRGDSREPMPSTSVWCEGSIECPKCGAPCPVGASDTNTKCRGCGHVIDRPPTLASLASTPANDSSNALLNSNALLMSRESSSRSMTSSSSSSLLILSTADTEVARVPMSAVDAELYSATSVSDLSSVPSKVGSAMSVVSSAAPLSEPKLLSDLPDESTPAQSRTEEWDIPYEDLVLERELGRGAFGVVYKGTWRLQDVAVKQLLGSTDKRGKRYRELLAECRLMMSLRPHRNVVQLLGVSANVGKPLCIVTAIADRGSLRDLLDDKRQQLVWPLVLRMLIGIGAGVHHLHLEKVLHRDLAARNVLLTAALEPQITDFGLSAKVLDPDDYKQAEFFRGPYKHMAPESLRDNEFSKKSDAWMFGVVAWELMTRREPHPDMDIYEAAKLIRKGATPAPLSKLPRPLKTLLESCWLFDPAARTEIEQSVMLLKAVKLSETEAWHAWPLQVKANVSPAVNAQPTSTQGGGGDVVQI
jgi:hypothetical protein